MAHSTRLLTLVSIATVCITLACSAILAYQRGLTSTLEGESAQTAREFLKTGDFSVNHLNGQEDYDKPPLFYWMIASFSLISHSVNELTSRLPSLVSALVIIILFPLIDQKKEARHIAVIASAMFIACPKVFWMSQTARIDMVLTLFCFSAIVFFILYRHETGRNKKAVYHYLFFVASALGVMAKGPVGMIIPWVPVFLFLLIKREFQEIKAFFLGKGLLIFVLIALPWFVVASIKTDGRFFNQFILNENLSRFSDLLRTHGATKFNHQPALRYIPYFMFGFFPWSLFFTAFVYHFFRFGKEYRETDRFLFVYFAFVFVFFTLSGVKRSDYILPLYPAAAYLCARFVSMKAADSAYTTAFVPSLLIFLITGAVLTSAPLFTNGQIGHAFLSRYVPAAKLQKQELIIAHAADALPFSAVLLAVTLGSFILGTCSRSRTTRTSALLVAVTAGFVYATVVILPFLNQQKDTRPYCAEIQKIVSDKPLYFYGFWDEELVFYLNRHINTIDRKTLLDVLSRKHSRLFVLVREKDYHRLVRKHGIKAWVYHKGMPQRHRVYLLSNMPFSTLNRTDGIKMPM